MANQEHVKRLKQGVTGWNAWREENPETQPDLRGINLTEARLSRADLSDTYLSDAILRDADLSRSILSYADLHEADLREADMSDADLHETDLHEANLSGADLRYANLSGANLSGVRMEDTTIANVDLRTTKGLAEIVHLGPSMIQLHTIQLLQDGSALHFLRGAGVPDEYIALWRSTTMHPIQYYSLFISYSSKDETLARRLHADLQASGVRCWFAPEDLKIGTKFRQRIDEAIHLQDKLLLLLLSEHSIASTWVENEVEAALEKEDWQQREVLFPVRLDDTVMQTSQAWAATLRRTRHIGDFTNWTNPPAYQSAFDRLLRDLKQK